MIYKHMNITFLKFVTGLSIIQNGKIPTFLFTQFKEMIFSLDETAGLCVNNLREGLKKVGVYQVGTKLYYVHTKNDYTARASKKINHELNPYK